MYVGQDHRGQQEYHFKDWSPRRSQDHSLANNLSGCSWGKGSSSFGEEWIFIPQSRKWENKMGTASVKGISSGWSNENLNRFACNLERSRVKKIVFIEWKEASGSEHRNGGVSRQARSCPYRDRPVITSLKTTLQSQKLDNIKYLAGLYSPACGWLWDFITCG